MEMVPISIAVLTPLLHPRRNARTSRNTHPITGKIGVLAVLTAKKLHISFGTRKIQGDSRSVALADSDLSLNDSRSAVTGEAQLKANFPKGRSGHRNLKQELNKNFFP